MKQLMKLALAMVLVAGLGSSARADAILTLLHGVPLAVAQPVTVFADGGKVVTFSFGESAGPLSLPAGTYDIEVYVGDVDTPTGTKIEALSGPLTLVDGVNYTAVAHLSEGGNILLSVFANNTSKLAARNQSRLEIRHTAAAPAVDVQVNNIYQIGRFTIPTLLLTALDIANMDEGGPESFGAVNIPYNRIQAEVRLAGTSTTVLKSPILAAGSRQFNIVYVIGSAADGSLRFFVQKISL